MDRESSFLIALEMEFPDILNYCKASKIVNESVCKREAFWVTKLRKDFEFPFASSQAQNGGIAKEYYKILYLTQIENKEYHARTALRKHWKELVIFIVKKYPYENWALLMEEAAIQNDMDMIKFLSQFSSDFYLDFYSGARGAVKTGNIELINYFLRGKYRVISTLIPSAMLAGDKAKETFNYLFSLLPDECKKYIKKYDDYGTLYKAARQGRVDLIEHLINLGFENWNGGLEGAARSKNSNSVKLVEFFIQKGANLEKPEQALYLATYIAKKTKSENSYKIIEILARHGAFDQLNPLNNTSAFEQALKEATGDTELTSFLLHF